MPLYLKHIPYDRIKTRWRGCGPAENCFILRTLHSLNVVVVDGLESQRNVLERFEDFDSPTAFKLVHESAWKYTFPCSMANVHKCTTRDIKCVVPAVRVLVLPCLLDPFEHLEEWLKFDLAICQADLFEAFLMALSSTFGLLEKGKQISLNDEAEKVWKA